ncbi:MAG: glycosyltransferase family 2 protein, partial [Kiritimatiellia bacterium]
MPLPPRADPDIRFSVILPVHQGERYLEEALESLRAQPAEFRKHLEVIAVDDGSTDRSPEILQAWKQELRVTLHSRQGGSNWMSATNDGLKLAQGTWISFLHQDDLWDPQRLPDLDQAIRENPEVRFFCHPVQLIGPSGKRFGTWNPPLKCGNALEVSSVMPRLVTQNPLGIPAPCFHRSLLEAENGLREDLWFLADWDFWLRLLSKSRKLLCLPDALASFRIHPESQTMTRSHQEAELRTQFGEIHEWVRQQFNGQ